MADIKPELAAEKPLPLNEKPLAGDEKLKQSLERFDNGEKAVNLEQARIRVIEEISQTEKAARAAAGPVGGVAAPAAKLQKQVENVLAEGMQDIYLSLAPAKRKEFKKAGEETAKKISRLLARAKINIGEIIKLIKKWLSLIPGLNKYFLEQAAKIKADEIVKIKQENKN